MRQPSTSVSRAAALLCSAERPALLIGPEGRPARALLMRLALLLGAELLNTPDALGDVDAERGAGTYSFAAPPNASRVAEGTDVLLAVSGLSEFTNRLGNSFVQARIIQLTASATDVGRNASPVLALVGPIMENLERLERLVRAKLPTPRPRWHVPSEARGLAAPPAPRPGVIHPAAAIEALQAALPDPARLCLDVTSGSLHAAQRLRLRGSQRVFSSIERSACMGEAFMASMGIRLASGVPTLALVGDWCYLMSPSELHFAVEHQLEGYVVLVWANGGGALVGAGVEQQGIDVARRAYRWGAPPRFAKIARALNASAIRVTDARALGRAVRRGLSSRRPLLIEACIDPDAAVPAGDRFLTLGVERR